MAQKNSIVGLARPPGENIGHTSGGSENANPFRVPLPKITRARELLASLPQKKVQEVLRAEFGSGLCHNIISQLTQEVRQYSPKVDVGQLQEEFCVEKLKQYRAAHPKRIRAGPRRVHYWVASKLPLDQRQIPSKNGRTAEYCHTPYWCNVMSHRLADARVNGHIPWAWISDDKNPPLVRNTGRKEAHGSLLAGITLPILSPPPEMELPMWDTITHNLTVDASITPARFAHQSHYLIVVIEKEPDDPDLRQLASKYGADWQSFTGMFSVTRVKEAMDVARERGSKAALKAKTAGLPVCVFYISDLDPAGYDMSRAYAKRMQQLYPHPNHRMIRVGITRDQMLSLQLPLSLSKKKYSEKRMERYEVETGERDCTELDAVETEDLCRFLEDAIQPFANFKEDEQATSKLRVEYEAKAAVQTELLRQVDFTKEGQQYEVLLADQDAYNAHVQKLQEEEEELAQRVQDWEDQINEKITAALPEEEEEEKSGENQEEESKDKADAAEEEDNDAEDETEDEDEDDGDESDADEGF